MADERREGRLIESREGLREEPDRMGLFRLRQARSVKPCPGSRGLIRFIAQAPGAGPNGPAGPRGSVGGP